MEQRKNQQGFTLIEIIAVIVLLGVLAAVLVPKFTNLTNDARQKALSQAIAEGQARINQGSAAYILSNGVVPTTWTLANLGVSSAETSGDYTIKYGSPNAGTVAITAGYTASAYSAVTSMGTGYLPTAATTGT